MKKLIMLLAFLPMVALMNAQNVPTNGLVGYWTFSGNTQDQSGNGNHGTLNCSTDGSNPVLAADRFGNANSAYQFGGVDNPNWISVPNSTSLQFSNTFAISFWFMQSSSRGGTVADCSGTISDDITSFVPIAKGGYGDCGSAGGFRIALSHASGMVNVGMLNTPSDMSSQDLMINTNYPCYEANEWVHCVVTMQNDTLRLYLNGVLYGAIVDNAFDLSMANMQDLYFGAIFDNASLYPFSGCLDEIAIYNRGLTNQEVKELYGNYAGSSTEGKHITLDSIVVTNPCGANKGSVRFYAPDGTEYYYTSGMMTSVAQSTPVFYVGPVRQRYYVMSSCAVLDTVIETVCQCEIDATEVEHDSVCPGETGTLGSIVTVTSYDFNDGLQGWSSEGEIEWLSDYHEDCYSGFGYPQVYGHNTTKSLFNCNYDGLFNVTTSYLISPAITLPYKLSKTTLTFWYNSTGLQTQVATGANTVILEYSTSTSGPWVQLWRQPSQSQGSWAEVSVSLASIPDTGTYYFRITRTGNGYEAAFDDFKITSDTRRTIPAEVTAADDGATVRVDKELESTGLCPITETTLWYVKPRTQSDTTVYALSQFVWNNHTYTESGDYKKTGMKNANGCDSTAVLHLEITLNTRGDTVAIECDSFEWYGMKFTASSNSQTHIVGPNSYGGDSIVTLRLTINYSKSTPIEVKRCSEYTYREKKYTSTCRDTVHLTTSANCDSAILLNLEINYPDTTEIVDSVCETASYLFNDQELRAPGRYRVVLENIHSCDSTVTLYLSHILQADVDYQYTFNCQDASYEVWGITSKSYHKWSSTPKDPDLVGHEYDDTIHVVSGSGYTYTFYADYQTSLYCPNSVEALLPIIEKTKAKLTLQPKYLSLDQLTLTAHDRSTNTDNREWYVDGEWVNSGSEHINYSARPEDDTVVVTLVVFNGECSDTVSAGLPIIRSTVYVPNAFTPTLPTSNKSHFFVTGVGITDYEIHIYNRGGLLMYHSTNMEEAWDGTYRGELCPQGGYTYILRYKDRITPGNWQYKTGSITLIH